MFICGCGARAKLGLSLGFQGSSLVFGQNAVEALSVPENPGSTSKMITLGAALADLVSGNHPTCTSVSNFNPAGVTPEIGSCQFMVDCAKQCEITIDEAIYSLAPTFIISSLCKCC